MTLILSLVALAACDTDKLFEEEQKIIDEVVDEVVGLVFDTLQQAKQQSYIVTQPEVLGEQVVIDDKVLKSVTIDEFGIEIFETPADVNIYDMVDYLRENGRFRFVEDPLGTQNIESSLEERIHSVIARDGIMVSDGEVEAPPTTYEAQSFKVDLQSFESEAVQATLCGQDIDEGTKVCNTVYFGDVPGGISLENVSPDAVTLSLTDVDGFIYFYRDLSAFSTFTW